MFNDKKIIGVTGPSVFSPEIQKMVEKRIGAIPLYITQNGADIDYVISQIDGLILAGGNDIFPGTYGMPLTYNDSLTKFDILRDKREIYLIEKCKELNKPIFAICRGMQILCVHHGFPIYADINCTKVVHAPGEIKVDLESGAFMHYIRPVNNEAKAILGGEYQPGVNSYHHQAICQLNDGRLEKNGLRVLAVADLTTEKKKNTEIIEAILGTNKKIIGTQFHPEADWEYGNVASNAVIDKFISFFQWKILS